MRAGIRLQPEDRYWAEATIRVESCRAVQGNTMTSRSGSMLKLLDPSRTASSR